ncbi:MAG: hypothetical protein HY928_06030 [Elusimicrobia bacterium]|nr:hypothetical protein [Elusimicrobiota bacterium]
MEIQISPIKPVFDHTRPQLPMPLPPIPLLPPHKRDRRERRRSVPYMPLAEAPAPVFLSGGAPAVATVAVSRQAAFLRSVARALEDGFLSKLALRLAAPAFAASAVFLAFQVMSLTDEGEAQKYAAVVMPSVAAERALRPAAAPEPAPADPRSLIIPEELGAPSARVTDAPAAVGPAAPEPEQGPQSAEDAGAAVALADALKDDPRLARPGAAGRERIAWGGIRFQSTAPLGGEFRQLREPKPAAVLGRAAGAPAAGGASRRSALSRSARRLAGGSKVLPGSAQRAMGQLKLARTLSVGGAQSSSFETARQGSGDAFEQAKSIGGAGLSADAMPNTGLSGGAPDVTAAPSTGPGENKTPYQDKVDDAKKKNGMTKMMLILGALLLAAGAALLVMAQGDLEPATKTMLTNIGYALLGAGAAMVLAGFMMGRQAKDDGKAVADQYGQTEQGAVIEDCADQALGKRDCAPKAVEQPKTTVGTAAAAEREAGNSLGGR